MELITNNIETIITFVTMVITWILGSLSKKSQYINNNLILIQNILVGIISAVLYYIITKDFSMTITMSGVLAETGYNLFHNIEKLIKYKKEETNTNQNNNESQTKNKQEDIN